MRVIGQVRAMQRACREAGLRSASGWTGFSARFTGDSADEYVPMLEGHVLDSVLFGRKSVHLLTLTPAERSVLLDARLRPLGGEDIFQVIEELGGKAWAVDSTTSRSIVLRSPRRIARRQELAVEDLGPDAQARVGAAAKIVATVQQTAPGFDVLEIPKSGTAPAELRLGTEFGDDFRLVGKVTEVADQARVRLGLVADPTGGAPIGQAVDLFPAVAALRAHGRAHELVEMAFESADGYAHRGRSPRGGGDLAADSYHHAGEQASVLHAYAVTARWEREGRRVDLELPGKKTALMAAPGTVRLRNAVVRAESVEDFRFGVDQLRAHLP